MRLVALAEHVCLTRVGCSLLMLWMVRKAKLSCANADCEFRRAADVGILNQGAFTTIEDSIVANTKGTGAEVQFAGTFLIQKTWFQDNKNSDVFLKSASDTIYASHPGQLKVRSDSINTPQGLPDASTTADFLNASNPDFLALQEVRSATLPVMCYVMLLVCIIVLYLLLAPLLHANTKHSEGCNDCALPAHSCGCRAVTALAAADGCHFARLWRHNPRHACNRTTGAGYVAWDQVV
jgi:hypothetical protein